MEGFKLREMIINGWPVLTVLLVMSILSFTVILDRIAVFRRARIDRNAFLSNLLKMLSRGGVQEALTFCKRFSCPLSVVAAAIVERPAGSRAELERTAEHALQEQINELESYVSVLATIASTAPFVGLLGTVIGIIRAFNDIAANMGGGPEVVSAGIAEALITTAVGLFVAIPASIAYNSCIRFIQRVAQDTDHAVYEVIEKVTARPE